MFGRMSKLVTQQRVTSLNEWLNKVPRDTFLVVYAAIYMVVILPNSILPRDTFLVFCAAIYMVVILPSSISICLA
jgi:hypothetical protein